MDRYDPRIITGICGYQLQAGWAGLQPRHLTLNLFAFRGKPDLLGLNSLILFSIRYELVFTSCQGASNPSIASTLTPKPTLIGGGIGGTGFALFTPNDAGLATALAMAARGYSL